MTKAIYPGSFDPITLGHLDIIKRIHSRFSELVIVVANNKEKSYMFSLEEREQMIRENLVDLPGVKIDKWDSLIVEYARKVNAQVIVRGLRAISDFEYEFAMANMNRQLNPEVETMIVFTRPEYSYVASRMVKEVGYHGGDLSNLVPKNVAQALTRKAKGGR
jgi:pantetheine-phosphate adenylyltransferase